MLLMENFRTVRQSLSRGNRQIPIRDCGKPELHQRKYRLLSSPRVTVGLTDKAYADLKTGTQSSSNKKSYNAACQRNESRRWLYPKNWKQWPQTITIKSSDDTPLSGKYERASCEQTVNMNTLWIREATKMIHHFTF